MQTDWYVVQVCTLEAGQKIGICEDPDLFLTISGPWNQRRAEKECKAYSKLSGIPMFNNQIDEDTEDIATEYVTCSRCGCSSVPEKESCIYNDGHTVRLLCSDCYEAEWLRKNEPK